MPKSLYSLIMFLLTVSTSTAQTSPEDIAASVAEHDKANIAIMKNDLEEAYIHLEKAIELDPTNSTFLNNAAYMAMQMENFGKSLEYLHMALELDKKKFGKDHMNVASVLNNIASVYSKMGDRQRAITYYKQAHSMVVEKLGEKHPQAEIIKNLLLKEEAK